MNTTWEKSSAALVELFGALAPKDARVTEKKMFGWPTWFVNGNLFAGLHKEMMLFRLPEKDQAEFLKQNGAAGFEPMAGRKMKGYVTLDNPLGRDRSVLAGWIERSLKHAGALPAKAAKAKKQPARRSP